ncbi:hypothetical protein LshimejAT787_1101360 [Lyophyllum shimeji]|uniref:Uncharacterized protein n=1 Tax=Lyophyllum shimeji TaxID=47721 RepID=A0A9P3PVS7_LYOSH|nr:hypothetical protein LshimejAT787_1101360 [Lyophyllum shimeji]
MTRPSIKNQIHGGSYTPVVTPINRFGATPTPAPNPTLIQQYSIPPTFPQFAVSNVDPYDVASCIDPLQSLNRV